MPEGPQAAADRQRRLMRAGGLVLLLLTAAALLLPVLLVPSRPAVRAGRSSTPSEPARGWTGSDGVPDETTPRVTPATQGLISASAPTSEAERAAAPETVGGPPAPTIVRRRTHQGVVPPPAISTSRATDTARASEWDRSPDARQRGVEQFGGTPWTESAVEAGLSWLAAHQSPNGIWDRMHFNRRCPDGDECGGVAVQRTEYILDAGVTGLALLAFLGAGYTDRDGPYQDVVRGAVEALLKMQGADGGFGAGDAMAGYNDSLAMLALAEHFALTGDPRLREPLQRAVARLAASQQALGGWDYGRRADSARNDTSITAWNVQALHACAAAGLDVPPRALVKAALHLARATEPDGRVWYADSGLGFKLDSNLRPVYTYTPAMTAAGLMGEQLLGWRLDGATPTRQRGLVLANLPSAPKARGRDPTKGHNEYYWYYGTLAMFQRGGEDWERWNTHLRDALLPLQDREKKADGGKRHAFGSWPPFGPNWGLWGEMGSRVYTTAICTLTLEIYYRHTPAYLRDEVVFTADDWRAYLKQAAGRQRWAAVQCLAQLRIEVAEPVLVELLDSDERRVALAAAEALAWLDSPRGVKLIDDVITTLPPWERESLERALERGKAVAALPPVEGTVRVYDPQARLATVDLPRSYIGMQLTVYRGDGSAQPDSAPAPVARLRVIQRFTGRTVAVAEIADNATNPALEPGDRVVGR
jgi:hypothetical protein